MKFKVVTKFYIDHYADVMNRFKISTFLTLDLVNFQSAFFIYFFKRAADEL